AGAGCAGRPEGVSDDVHAGNGPEMRARSTRFVYSPYKHLPIALDPVTRAISTAARGTPMPIVVAGRSTLPAGLTALTLAFATGECGAESWDRIAAAQKSHPELRLSFTLATWAADDGSLAGLNAEGERVLMAVRDAGVADFYINLMVMDYGEANPGNCVASVGVCDMGRSAIQ